MNPKIENTPGAPRRGSRIALWGFVALAAIVSAVLMVSARRHRVETVTARPAEKALAVSVMEVRTSDLVEVITLPGRLEPSFDAVLPARKPGAVDELRVQKGDRVAAGQVLARIDGRTWAARCRTAEIEDQQARRDLERWTRLTGAGAISGKDLDEARARVERAKAGVEEAGAALDQCVVRAPVAGVITDRHVELGEFAPEGGAVCRLVCLDPMTLAADVPEQAITGVGAGQFMVFRADAWPDQIFTGRVTFVSSVAARANNSFRIEMCVPNPAGRLRGGMVVRVELERRDHRAAIVIPLGAIVPRRGELVAYVEQEGRAVRRVIRVDRIAGDRAVVLDGLSVGDRLIVDGQRALADGSRVTVASSVAPDVGP